MSKRKPTPIARPATTLTLHLGDDSRAHLDRCRQLLTARDPGNRDMTLGSVVRIALRRLLLGILGERADWSRAADPVAAEYVRELEQQLREERRAAGTLDARDIDSDLDTLRGGQS